MGPQRRTRRPPGTSPPWRLGLAILALLTASWLALASMGGREPGERLLFEKDSLYHHVMVTESAEGLRYLSFNRAMGHQSAVRLGHPEELTFAYTKSAFAALAFLERPPEDVLFVGLGGGSMPMYLRLVDPQVNMDIAEIDPEVARVAGEYLGFKPDQRMRVAVMDGRMFLKRHDKRYDLIFLDAYNDHAVPFHLTTREFLELVRSRLRPGGVVVGNIWSEGLNSYFPAMVKTYQQVFPQVYILRAASSANHIFLATLDPGQVPAEKAVARARQVMAGRSWSFDLAELVGREYECHTGRAVKAQVLTDDHAPVNLLRTQRPKGDMEP